MYISANKAIFKIQTQRTEVNEMSDNKEWLKVENLKNIVKAGHNNLTAEFEIEEHTYNMIYRVSSKNTWNVVLDVFADDIRIAELEPTEEIKQFISDLKDAAFESRCRKDNQIREAFYRKK